MKLPIVRGAVALFHSLIMGVTALNFSANEAMVEEEGEEKKDLSPWAMAGTMAFAFGFGILLFFIMPLYLTKLMIPVIGDSNIVFNLVDGVIRVIVFLLYIWIISRMEDIQRVFQYHGAEHKSIFAFEAGEALTVDNVRKYSCLHPRCGTSFLLIVMVVSIVVFSLIPKLWPFYLKAASRVVFLPLIAGSILRVPQVERKKRPVTPGEDDHCPRTCPAETDHPRAGRQPARGGDPLHGRGVGGECRV